MSHEPEPLDNLPEVQPASPPDLPSSEDRSMAMLCHIGGAFGFVIPLVVWAIKKDKSPFVDDQGKEAINFHLTMLIGHLIGGATICFTFGILNIAVGIVALVFSILGGIEANKGVRYRYPMCIRFIS